MSLAVVSRAKGWMGESERVRPLGPMVVATVVRRQVEVEVCICAREVLRWVVVEVEA